MVLPYLNRVCRTIGVSQHDGLQVAWAVSSLGHEVDVVGDRGDDASGGGRKGGGAEVVDGDMSVRPFIHGARMDGGCLEEGGGGLLLGRRAIRLEESQGTEPTILGWGEVDSSRKEMGEEGRRSSCWEEWWREGRSRLSGHWSMDSGEAALTRAGETAMSTGEPSTLGSLVGVGGSALAGDFLGGI